MATTQRAVFVTEVGKPVQLGSREIPSPKEQQVLVKVTATMILPHDAYGRDWGLLINQKLPAILGGNVAGIIDKVGSEVTKFEAGDRIFGISFPEPESNDQGGLQEYAILNADAIGKIPDGFSDEQVVTLPINLATSWAALFTKTGFDMPVPFEGIAGRDNFDYASASVLIVGGGTNVGQFAIQLAHLAGVGNIIVVAGSSNTDRLKTMGATHVIDRHASVADIMEQIQTIMGSEDLTQIYSCAPLNLDLVIAALPENKPAVLRTLLPLEDDEVKTLKLKRPSSDARFISDLTNESLAPYAERFWTELSGWLKDGSVLPTDYRVIEGLEKVNEINDALDAYRDFARAGAQTVVRV